MTMLFQRLLCDCTIHPGFDCSILVTEYPLKLRPYGAIQICFLLLLLLKQHSCRKRYRHFHVWGNFSLGHYFLNPFAVSLSVFCSSVASFSVNFTIQLLSRVRIITCELSSVFQIHTDARKYKCQQCGKAFKQRQGLRLHVVIHSVDRPFKCEYCSKTFTQHSALVRHTRTHTSARPFACRFCPAAFNDYSVLRRHMLGIHKLHNVAELRHSVKAACAEARLAQCSNTDTLLPTSSATDTNTTAACDRLVNTDDAATSVSVSSDVLASSPSNADMRIGTSAAQMIVLSPSSAHSDAQTSVADSLPHYVLIDAWWSVERHQTNV